MQNSMEWTQVTEWADGQAHDVQDALAVEEPLEIRVGGRPLTVTMRTPGHDRELAAGFLLTEGIVEDADQILELAPIESDTGRSNVVDATLSEMEFDPENLRRNFFAASSCGICGKATIEAIRRRGLKRVHAGLELRAEVLCGLPKTLSENQAVFGHTGGLHAAALFGGNGELLVLREDIGRHNAVDKVIGWAALRGELPVKDRILMVSGRGGFEIVQKAVAAGIPIVACVSAPSSLAVKLAREFGVTLIGFLRERRFVVYSGRSRCVATPA